MVHQSCEIFAYSISRYPTVPRQHRALIRLKTVLLFLGIGPQNAMQIAERLYTQGYISYPRTETTHYPENFDLKGALKQQINNSHWAEEVRVT